MWLVALGALKKNKKCFLESLNFEQGLSTSTNDIYAAIEALTCPAIYGSAET